MRDLLTADSLHIFIVATEEYLQPRLARMPENREVMLVSAPPACFRSAWHVHVPSLLGLALEGAGLQQDVKLLVPDGVQGLLPHGAPGNLFVPAGELRDPPTARPEARALLLAREGLVPDVDGDVRIARAGPRPMLLVGGSETLRLFNLQLQPPSVEHLLTLDAALAALLQLLIRSLSRKGPRGREEEDASAFLPRHAEPVPLELHWVRARHVVLDRLRLTHRQHKLLWLGTEGAQRRQPTLA
mmetsp:Transcript_61139/g.196977  ORF Transcript_61139/g.196977 Transcript_61139/m.196977 type:complete len:243 (-) Transcript_61139:1373-2101(-)